MQRLRSLILGMAGGASVLGGEASGQVATGLTPSGQAATPVASPREVQLLQALRAHPATAPYAFATEPRGSRILLRGRVGARIVHDVAIRTAIALGVPVEDGITIDTAFAPGGPAGAPGFGPVPGPGLTSSGNAGFGGPPAFGNMGYGAGYAGGFGGGYPGGPPLVAGYPSAGSYGGAPSLLPPPIFGRYDDPFYGFDPPSVIYPPWWGALNAQRQASNLAFDQALAATNEVANANVNANGVAAQPGAMVQAAGSPIGANPPLAGANGAPLVPTGTDGTVPADMTATDIGLIPDGTIDMAIDGQGVATLRGAVPSMAERIAVGQRVATTPGVTQVVNLLSIKPALANRVGAANAPAAPAANGNNPPPPPVPADAAPANANAIAVPAVNRPAPIVSTPARPGAALDPAGDSGLADRVGRALADRAALLNAPVRVKVQDGVATITGKVPSAFEAMLAYRTVQQTPGVRGIDDRLEFTVPADDKSNPLLDRGRPDDVEPYLEAQIKRQVGDFAHIDRVRLQADVLDVRGTLSRAEDRDRFDAILRSMPLLRGYQVHADMPVPTP